MKISKILLQLILVITLSLPAYGAGENKLIELNISNMDSSSIFYIQRGLEKAKEAEAQGLIIKIHNIPAPNPKQDAVISEAAITKLEKLTKGLYNSTIPVIIYANNSNIETQTLILYLSADIAVSDEKSKFGSGQNIKIDEKLMGRYDELINNTATATGKNPAISSALARNFKQISASEAVKYGFVNNMITSDKELLAVLKSYDNKELYLKNKHHPHIDDKTQISVLEKDLLDNMQSILDPDSPSMVWIDLILWIIILGVIIIYAPFLLPILGYIIPIIAIIISGIIFFGTPQSHDIIYTILGIIIGIAIITINLMFLGSIILSLVGLAIIIYALLPAFGVNFGTNIFGGGFTMNSIVITGITVLAIVVGVIGIVIYLAAKSQTKPTYNGNITMIGRTGRIIGIDEENGRYKIQIEDEIWDAVSDNVLFASDRVEVTEVDGLILKVKRV